MRQGTGISRQIWDMKYRLKTPEGQPVDATIEDSWRRVARSLAQPEADPVRWEAEFYDILDGFKFLPAGRILSGAGTDRRVTLFNCFVMGDIPDDMAGIFEHLKEAALTMQQGGGIGYDFSTLRPKGAVVRGVGADASGPLSFMDVWDAMCRTIMSAGSRRGAMMATLRCDHPDIESFIEAKQEPGRLRMFNLSVLVTDAFMDAVEQDRDWDLVFGGRTYRTVKARDLWDRIMRATYAYAEPGVIFIDRINRRNNLWYVENIHATNPCLTADTWVQTAEGPRRVGELVGRPFTAIVNGGAHESGPQGFFSTGRKPVLRLTTREGHLLRLTDDHPLRKVVEKTRYRLDTVWAKAGELAPGDRVMLNDHRGQAEWPGAHGRAEGYLLGLLVGDGTLKEDKAVLSVWPGRLAVNGGWERPGIAAVMEEALEAARRMPHRSDFVSWMEVPGRGEWRLSLAALRRLALALGLSPARKTITPAVEVCSSDFYRGFLRGLFDADGSVQGSQQKGVSLRLAQSDLDLLRAVQRMLLRLGIACSLYRNRRLAASRALPDGKGGMKAYDCAAQHELVISGENIVLFAEKIGFADSEKSARLAASLANYRRALNREAFIATIDCLGADGEEEVFDVQIPGINAFDANGLLVHNCGEQPLPPYGVCLLGSVNLAKLVEKPFAPDAGIDLDKLSALVKTAVRMLDNVIDVSNFPLEAHRREAFAKRRIGLGVTGLADALILCRARYGGGEAVRLTETWMAAIRRAAYLASVDLAREKGAFPLFDAEPYLAGETVRELDEDVREAIRAHGIRNALLTSIAPTGTISLFADNVSSGLEPVFSFAYTRSVLQPDGSRRDEEVTDYAYRLYRRMAGDGGLPDYFVDAQTLSPSDHVVMQAVVQKYIDSSISKTINLPESISFEAFKDVYRQAYDLGCKGCTTYRPNDVTGAVLQVRKEAEEKPRKEQEARKTTLVVQPELPFEAETRRVRAEDEYESGVVYMTQPLDRPEALPGATYKLRWHDSDHALYITINDIIQDGRRRPFEVFINSKNMEHYAWTVALTRMISAVFRRGGDVAFVVEELKAVFDPRGGQWMGGRYVPSLLAAIGEVIERHMTAIGFLANPGESNPPPQDQRIVTLQANRTKLAQCPKCGQPSLLRQEGCDTCTSCGYSKCG
ncbi:LAGLIDADG family homing endonuclease [Telmatospirillum sp. J64-1]|uniref:LAGLIDADG family homing endonuclease n=1 Tax=Telmatospirillum sp. J64-1 TaxID=2502183 RepID=UPI00115CCF86|nr:LAGLIDADG family homing endonuclease [Telmatospirillum sp. J64-1]